MCSTIAIAVAVDLSIYLKVDKVSRLDLSSGDKEAISSSLVGMGMPDVAIITD
jgi:hypothetical protein